MDLPSVRALFSFERPGKVMEMIPVRRLGNSNLAANTAVQLASSDADFVTGATWKSTAAFSCDEHPNARGDYDTRDAGAAAIDVCKVSCETTCTLKEKSER